MRKHSVRSWCKSHTLCSLIIKSHISISLDNEINLLHTIILPKTQFHKNPKAQLSGSGLGLVSSRIEPVKLMTCVHFWTCVII